MKFWRSILHHAKESPTRLALGPVTYDGLRSAVTRVVRSLPDMSGKRVGLFLGNGPLFGVYDIALTLKGAVVVPLPGFFSTEQLEHLIVDAALDTVVIESGCDEGFHSLLASLDVIEADTGHLVSSSEEEDGGDGGDGQELVLSELSPSTVVKIIYTSGTTGSPRGVMVTLAALEAVTESLIERSEATGSDSHLSLLPLSTLLEIIGGIYVPLTVGATVTYLPAGGMGGVTADPSALIKAIEFIRPTTTIVVPSLLELLVRFFEEAGVRPEGFRFIACGGAPVAVSLLLRAEALGLPVFQGYGLSECASVVTLNELLSNRIGSVGKPLSHAGVTVSEEGEIVVTGPAVLAGYASGGKEFSLEYPTGDIGRLDEDGYLYIEGRKDNVIALANGRNLSPEWVEGLVSSLKFVKQVVVFGTGMEGAVALLVVDHEWLRSTAERFSDKSPVEELVDNPLIIKTVLDEIIAACKDLPDYAHIQRVKVLAKPFTIENGLLTHNWRPRRKEIFKRYEKDIERLYEEDL